MKNKPERCSTGPVWLFAILAAFVNTLPVALMHVGGDLILNITQIKCFSEQLWSGRLYPHWCMDANIQMGSPIPMFYFPLPYYLSSVFYPLHYLGLSLYGVFICCLFFVNCVTFVTCVVWLKSFVKTSIACYCACLFLWMPYRMELMGFRVAYAELCALALMPLIFHFTRSMARGENKWAALACVIAPGILAHAQATLVALMGAGLYLIIVSRGNLRSLFGFAIAVALGFLFTLFHWLPATHFIDALNSVAGGIAFWRASWTNGYVSAFLHDERYLQLLTFIFMIILALSLGVYSVKNIFPSSEPKIKSELLAWWGILICAVLLMFPMSAPLWTVIETVSRVKTPWRMSILLIFFCVCSLALVLQWFVNQDKNIRVGDKLVFLSFCMFCGLASINPAYDADDSAFKKIYSGYFIPGYALPESVEGKYLFPPEIFFKEYELPANSLRASLQSGDGNVQIRQWNDDGIAISVAAKRSDVLRIEHFYFPIWQATMDGAPVVIHAQEKTGRMLIDVPAGKHELTLWVDVAAVMPAYYRYMWLLSAAIAGVVAYGFFSNRKRNALSLMKPAASF